MGRPNPTRPQMAAPPFAPAPIDAGPISGPLGSVCKANVLHLTSLSISILAAFCGWFTWPTSAAFRRGLTKALSGRLWIPVAFQPPAFASWAIPSSWGVPPPLRLAYWPGGCVPLSRPDPKRVSTFRTVEMRPGGVLSLRRGLVSSHGNSTFTMTYMKLSRTPCLGPFPRLDEPSFRLSRVTAPRREFLYVTRPVFP